MLNVNYKVTYGEVTLQREGFKAVKIQYHQANCDGGAFIYHYKENGKKYAQLWMFIDGKRHIETLMKDPYCKGKLFGEDIKKVRLNVYYKEARMILEACCKSGYKVECYYEAPTN